MFLRFLHFLFCLAGTAATGGARRFRRERFRFAPNAPPDIKQRGENNNGDDERLKVHSFRLQIPNSKFQIKKSKGRETPYSRVLILQFEVLTKP